MRFSSLIGHLAIAGNQGVLTIDERRRVRETVESPPVFALAWSPDGQVLAFGGDTRYLELLTLDPKGKLRLEGHQALICSASYSFDGRVLASASRDGFVIMWNPITGGVLATIGQLAGKTFPTQIAFSPRDPLLATIEEEKQTINVWEIDIEALLGSRPVRCSVRYSNAKVVLVGDTGVGKSGLGLVLAGKKWKRTESTHGRHVWVFDSQDPNHEILLWDLAGQPDYRIIHQLHLSEVSVALVLFDSRSQTDPFAGVRHWARALRLARQAQGQNATPLVRILVAARCDVGHVGVPQHRVDALKSELGFDHFIETSAKEGAGVTALARMIRQAIDWSALPTVSSSALFQKIKSFLVREKENGRLLSTVDDLYRTFEKSAHEKAEDLRAQFETCIGLVQSRGLIQRLTFGNLVLLQPELRDTYASAMVNAAKGEPDGWGSIREDIAMSGSFMPAGQRIKDGQQEKLLLIATVEDLLRHEIALREAGDDGQLLVFPSQLTRENPDLPNPQGKAAVFLFEGPTLNIYATLAVRLSHSGLFATKERWKKAAEFTARYGGVCGMVMREVDEGSGELTLFFNENTAAQTRKQFEDYIHAHLQRRALPDTIVRRRVIRCPKCGVEIPEEMVQLKLRTGATGMRCPVDEVTPIQLVEAEGVPSAPAILEIDRAADARRDEEAAKSTIIGKTVTDDFDVFISYRTGDRDAVVKIVEALKARGILPWIDVEQIRPGTPAQKELGRYIKKIKTAAVFVGKRGLGPWQDAEQEALIAKFVKRKSAAVIPVILPDSPKTPKLPPLLERFSWVDFRQNDPDPMKALVWGITGKSPLER
jgi:small GTP-binding protein